VLASLLLVLSACGNSGGDDDAASSTTAGGGSAPAAEGDRDTFVELSGVPGVTDDEISFTAIGTRTNNPLGTCLLDCYLEGIEAYFAFRNSEGGIYGRDLVVGEVLDDELGSNQVKSLEVASGDDAFGAFQATLLASGWGDLDAAGVPTYAWGIHAAEAANRPNIFPSLVIRCADCPGRSVPFAAESVGAERVAALGYGVTEPSKVCTNSIGTALEQYGDDVGAELAYLNDDLEYGLAGGVGPEVTAMKEAGVDFIATCMDLNAMKTLAQELRRQGMDDVTLYHPNTYNEAFVAEAGDLFEGDFVTVQFRPFEAEAAGTALEDFEEWMAEEGNEPSELAMVGWINATLAYESLLAAGPEFSRESVVAAANAMTAFDAGNLLVPIDWTVAHTPYSAGDAADVEEGECQALVRVEDGEFVTVSSPEQPWMCWPPGATGWSEPEPTSFEG
jgi:hypothetical protein